MNEVEAIKDRDSLEKMKSFLRGRSLRDWALFVLGINSGLRISDLLKLKLSDLFDSDERVKSRITLKEAKTGKLKDFPISDTARSALEEYAASLSAEAVARDLLFPSQKGGTLQRIQAYRIINAAAAAAGVTGRVGTHTLRKTFGYHAYMQCGDISLVMRLLNHSSEAVTLRYIGITQEDCDNVYLNLNL